MEVNSWASRNTPAGVLEYFQKASEDNPFITDAVLLDNWWALVSQFTALVSQFTAGAGPAAQVLAGVLPGHFASRLGRCKRTWTPTRSPDRPDAAYA